MSELMKAAGLNDIDPRLLEEAFRRACQSPLNQRLDRSAMLAQIFAEARRGTRHMHGLVSAAAKAA
jgi:hypothetical protein